MWAYRSCQHYKMPTPTHRTHLFCTSSTPAIQVKRKTSSNAVLIVYLWGLVKTDHIKAKARQKLAVSLHQGHDARRSEVTNNYTERLHAVREHITQRASAFKNGQPHPSVAHCETHGIMPLLDVLLIFGFDRVKLFLKCTLIRNNFCTRKCVQLLWCY